MNELRDIRSDLKSTRCELEAQRERIASLGDGQEELKSELAGLSETPAGWIPDIESDTDRLRQQKRRVESGVNEPRNVIQFSGARLAEDDSDSLATLDGGTETRESVTSQLIEDDTKTCWTCGSTVETDHIKETVDRLRELSQRKLGDARDIESDLDELQSQKGHSSPRNRSKSDSAANSNGSKPNSKRQKRRLQILSKEESLQDVIEGLETEVRELESTEYDEMLELHQEVNQREFEVDQIQDDIADVTEDIDHIERQFDERE
jgi:chromosome segregation ATPase